MKALIIILFVILIIISLIIITSRIYMWNSIVVGDYLAHVDKKGKVFQIKVIKKTDDELYIDKFENPIKKLDFIFLTHKFNIIVFDD